MSSDTPGSYLIDPLDAAVEFAWHAGIVVVDRRRQPRRRRRRRPVRAGQRPVRDLRRRDRRGRRRPTPPTTRSRRFSSRGRHAGRLRQAGDRRPGRQASSPRSPPAPRSRQLAPATSIVENGQYIRIGGTSMAAPVVAGAAALLLQARPDLNPDQVKALLTQNVSLTADQQNSLNIPAALARAARQGQRGPERRTRSSSRRCCWPASTRRAPPGPARRGRSATWTRATWTEAPSGPGPPGRATPPASTPRGPRATWTCATCSTRRRARCRADPVARGAAPPGAAAPGPAARGRASNGDLRRARHLGRQVAPQKPVSASGLRAARGG